MSTNIQWTDVTDNIIVAREGGWWCRKISPGCTHCYAEKLNQSAFFNGNKMAYHGQPPELALRTRLIESWQTQRKSKKHFVSSMTDVFGDWVPYDWAKQFLRGMWRAPNQTFQVLTKRPKIAGVYIKRWLREDGLLTVPSNILIGASIEDQPRADERIPELLKIQARLFLSVEPLLASIDLHGARHHVAGGLQGAVSSWKPSIEWVIVGGESGAGARPCNLEWIRKIVVTCKAAGVPCFVKQMGANSFEQAIMQGDPLPAGWCRMTGFSEQDYWRKQNHFKDRKGGNPSEWPADLRVREFPV